MCFCVGRLFSNFENNTHITQQFADAWHGDTAEIEGFNKLIKGECSRAPHIMLPLLDARTATTKEMKLGSRGASRKWSAIEPIFETLVCAACAQADDFTSVLHNPFRFATPDVISIPDMRQPCCKPLELHGRDPNSLAWIKNMSLAAVRSTKSSVSSTCAVRIASSSKTTTSTWNFIWLYSWSLWVVPCSSVGRGKLTCSGGNMPQPLVNVLADQARNSPKLPKIEFLEFAWTTEAWDSCRVSKASTLIVQQQSSAPAKKRKLVEPTTHDKEEATEELTIEYLLNPSLYHSPYDLNSDLRFVDGNIQYYDCKPKWKRKRCFFCWFL